MPKQLITHPKTGESLTRGQWAQKLGHSIDTIRRRIRNYDLETALSERKLYGKPRPTDWSQDEDEYLIEVYTTPNLVKNWNKVAKKRGWVVRSKAAIDNRLLYLRKAGLVESRKTLDESLGWVSVNQLAESLLISSNQVTTWLNHGLNYKPNTSSKNRTVYKIHLKDFTQWATKPEGAGLVGKAIASNPIGCTWLLIQIGNWK